MTIRHKVSILDKMPATIAYMKAAGVAANAVDPEEVDGNETLTRKITSVFQKEFAGIPEEAGIKRAKEDEKILFDWLQKHPCEKYPETSGLYLVVGMLTYPEFIYAK